MSFAAKRYREVNGKYVLTDWGARNVEYRDFNGVRLPSKSDVFWRLESGEFHWYKCEITEIDYNIQEMY